MGSIPFLPFLSTLNSDTIEQNAHLLMDGAFACNFVDRSYSHANLSEGISSIHGF
jgi:hypothetical protein